jgi:O-antigen/teichoic acid export membrane protein
MVSILDVAAEQSDAAWERSRIGDRLVGFTALLPADPDGVALCVGPDLLPFLVERYPAAAHGSGQGSARLIIAEESPAVAALRPALTADGVLAVLGRRGEFIVYPSLTHPEHIWRPGWPVPRASGRLAQFRRAVGVRTARWRGIPALSLTGAPFTSLADQVLADLAVRTGRPGRLVGIATGGQTILRVRQDDGDLAVRLWLSDGAGVTDTAQLVAADVPAVRAMILPEVATGTTHGCDWSATAWLPGRRRGLRPRAGTRRRWAMADSVCRALESAPTGRTSSGWAWRWCADIALIPPATRQRLAAAMAPLDAELPTGWCHGDLWPPNILIDGDRVGVIDWQNALPNAPLGLDRLLVAGLRISAAGSGSMGDACVRIIDGRLPVPHAVGGRPFDEWGEEQRTALGVAAFVQYLRNRSLHDLGSEQLAEELDTLLAALPVAGTESRADEQAPAAAGRAARGAIWLGLGAAVVKGAQTAVLLVVAALLAPSALGLLSLGALVMNIAQALGDIGAGLALVYWRGDPSRAARTALTISTATSTAIAAALWVAAPSLGAALHAGPDATWVLRGLVSVLPCYGIAIVSQELLRRELAFARRVLPDIVAALAGAAVSIVVAARGHGLAGVVAGQIVQGVLTLLLVWAVGQIVRPGWNREDARRLLRYGIQLTAAGVLGLVLINVDYVLVARVLGATALGEYSLAFRLAYLPFVNVGYVISGAAFAYLCRVSGRANGLAAERVVTAAMTVMTPICLGLALFADQLTLLGAKWQPAVPVVRWLALYAAMLSLAQLVYTTLNSVGRPAVTTRLRLLHLVVVVAVLAAVVRQGIVAVAFGQALAGASAATVGLIAGHRVLAGLRLARLSRALLPVAAGAIAMVVVATALHAMLPWTRVSVSGLFLVGVPAAVAFGVPVLLLGRADVARVVRAVREPS